jgi:hypothetical protein
MKMSWNSSKGGSNGDSRRRRSECGDGIKRNGGWGMQLAIF